MSVSSLCTEDLIVRSASRSESLLTTQGLAEVLADPPDLV